MSGQADDTPPRKGRGYPPIAHRWKPGTSGNPHGRPPGSKNKPRGDLTPGEVIALEEANRTITSSAGEMPVMRAVIRATAAAAVKGGAFAQRGFTDRILNIEAKAAASRQKICEGWEYYIRYYEELCLTATPKQRKILSKDLLPHPHDVYVDFESETVRILGPANTGERRLWRTALEGLRDLRKRILNLRRAAERIGQTRDAQLALLIATDSFMRHNDTLPDRYKLPALPKWRRAPPLTIFDEENEASES